jgi:hypothetical protein
MVKLIHWSRRYEPIAYWPHRPHQRGNMPVNAELMRNRLLKPRGIRPKRSWPPRWPSRALPRGTERSSSCPNVGTGPVDGRKVSKCNNKERNVLLSSMEFSIKRAASARRRHRSTCPRRWPAWATRSCCSTLTRRAARSTSLPLVKALPCFRFWGCRAQPFTRRSRRSSGATSTSPRGAKNTDNLLKNCLFAGEKNASRNATRPCRQ